MMMVTRKKRPLNWFDVGRLVFGVAVFSLLLVGHVTAWAGVTVDFGGEPVRALVTAAPCFSSKSEATLRFREIRIEGSERFPLSPSGARLDGKMRWQGCSGLAARSSPPARARGGHVRPSTPEIVFQARAVDARRTSSNGAGGRRPSFTLVGVRADNREEQVEVYLPFVVNIRISHE